MDYKLHDAENVAFFELSYNRATADHAPFSQKVDTSEETADIRYVPLSALHSCNLKTIFALRVLKSARKQYRTFCLHYIAACC